MGEILYKGRSLNTAPEDVCYENEARNMRVGDAGGKNLIPYPYSNKSGNYNGVEITINDDYSISVNGTNTGGRNDFGFAGISRISDIPYMVSLKEGKSYTLSLEFFRGSLPDTSDVVINGWNDNSVVMLLAVCDSSVTSFTFTVPADSGIKHGCVYLQNKSGTVFDNVRLRPMLTEGNEVVPYEPYIPSIKMLADETVQQNIEAMDLKMLGWTVPRECPIQNYVGSDGVFHQKVGRVDLGSLKWIKLGNNNYYASMPKLIKRPSSTSIVANMYCSKLNVKSQSYFESENNSIAYYYTASSELTSKVIIYSTDYTDETAFKSAMSGVYLYYELATEKTISVDGNEAVTKVNDSLSAIGKCKNLLNPTLQTTTSNGVTCTNNGDGTYTLNGTNGIINNMFKLNSFRFVAGRKYKLIGCPSGGDSQYRIGIQDGASKIGVTVSDNGDGVVFTPTITNEANVLIRSDIAGTVLNNIIFKPMITTNLNATYDDFVPYTGDGDTLVSDVGELKSDLCGIDISSGVTALATFKIDSIDLKLRGNHVSGNIVVSLQSGGVFRDSYVLQIPKEYAPKFKTPITANGYLDSSTKYLPGYGIIGTDGKVLFYSNNETSINIAYISFSYDI